MIIKNGLVFTLKNGGSFEPLTIETENDKIVRIIPAGDTSCSAEAALSGEQCIDATDCYVIPGLVDIHFHGAAGCDFSDGTTKALETICKYEFQNGITDICPATMTISEKEIEQVLESTVAFIQKWQSCEAVSASTPVNTSSFPKTFGFTSTAGSTKAAPLSDIIGIHMEGPFISPDKIGAQNPDYILEPDSSLIGKWLTKSQGLLRLMTIAPEMPDALGCIKQFGDKIHFSIGHTTADYNTAAAAFKAGADHITHLYNAMPPLTHRAPGVIGAAADSANCMVELICDGIHIDPAVVRSTFKLFGDDRVILISDSIRATGMPDGTYSLGGQTVTVRNGKATLTGKTIDNGTTADGTVADGTTADGMIANDTIAGSVTNLYDCMINTVEMGVPLISAIKAATINPCKSIGTDKLLGSIEVGKKAHLLLIDKENLSIRNIIK